MTADGVHFRGHRRAPSTSPPPAVATGRFIHPQLRRGIACATIRGLMTSSTPTLRRRSLVLSAHLLAVALVTALPAAGPAGAQVGQPIRNQIFFGVLGWPENQRAFYQDGPAWLLDRGQRDELLDLDGTSRDRYIEQFLADPIPETPENEMLQGINRRRALVLGEEIQSFQDARARLLFLHGEPGERFLVDCAETFRPLELW
ncbi:MAG: hypothetical protein AAFX50_16240, partial [Acidobacteriota bacterium]